MKANTARLLMLLATTPVLAEEGGSGHYLPGSAASFIDALPGRPSWAVFDFFTYYDGKAGTGRSLPSAGLTTLGLEATAYANSVGAIRQTPLKLLGGSYAAGLVVPWVWVEAEAGVVSTPGTVTRNDSASGIGDLTVLPFLLGWTHGSDLKYDLRMAVYVPSGDYDAGRLANPGKNYWTFEPGASVSWLSSEIGLELSAFAGVDFNTANEDTDYRSGTQFHLDLTVAEHLPLLGGFLGVGANAFYYRQVSGDTGPGATFGSFEGRTLGVGPVLSYATKLRGKTDFVTELKWLPELDTERRLEGDYVWFKLALVF